MHGNRITAHVSRCCLSLLGEWCVLKTGFSPSSSGRWRMFLPMERDRERGVPLELRGLFIFHIWRMWCKALLLEETSTHMFLYWSTEALHYVLHWAYSCQWKLLLTVVMFTMYSPKLAQDDTIASDLTGSKKSPGNNVTASLSSCIWMPCSTVTLDFALGMLYKFWVCCASMSGMKCWRKSTIFHTKHQFS